jgi:dihydrofolate reductase
MRKLILQVAVSLDGYIEGPNGEFDWCFMDQDYGMSEFFQRIDSVFYGRKSYELALSMEGVEMPHRKLNVYVFSTTLQSVKPGAVLVNGDVKDRVNKIKGEPGKASLLNLGLVDEVSLAIHPIILGSGKPLFDNIQNRIGLTPIDHKTYSTGLVFLTYTIS